MKTITFFVSLIFTVIFHVNSSYQSWPEQTVAENGSVQTTTIQIKVDQTYMFDISRMIICPLK